MTGKDYPTITVGAHDDLVVRLSLAAQLLLRRRGIEAAKLWDALAPVRTVPNPNQLLQTDPPTIKIPNPEAVQNTVTVFSCMVCENFIDTKSMKVDLNGVPTADYWATQIDDFPAVEKAVWAAIKKAVEERRQKLEIVPPTEAAAS